MIDPNNPTGEAEDPARKNGGDPGEEHDHAGIDPAAAKPEEGNTDAPLTGEQQAD